MVSVFSCLLLIGVVFVFDCRFVDCMGDLSHHTFSATSCKSSSKYSGTSI